jgi:hypothetical protein
VDELWSELVYLAYHLHWGLDSLLDLERKDRERLIEEVARLNQQAWEEVNQYG